MRRAEAVNPMEQSIFVIHESTYGGARASKRLCTSLPPESCDLLQLQSSDVPETELQSGDDSIPVDDLAANNGVQPVSETRVCNDITKDNHVT
jgi:hypothetical protein